MPLPKRRFSRSRRDKRRLQIHLTVPTLSRCSHCGAVVRSHQICSACGYYRGRQVLAAAQEKKKRS
ncbi:MAG: 50S ribosomal protein L32 [Candidatus Omnitrophica bacterium]|nr:50S ribosomal protein L32 [Candidatus Omnitrophota bacterium]